MTAPAPHGPLSTEARHDGGGTGADAQPVGPTIDAGAERGSDERRVARPLVVLVALALVVRFGAPAGLAAELAYLAVVTGGALLACLGARRSRHRDVAVWIASAIALTAAGDVLWQVLVWSGGPTDATSLADVFWLGTYLTSAAAMVRVSGGGRLDRDGLVDVAVVFVVAMVAQWELFVSRLLDDASMSAVDRLIALLYPAAGSALLALVVRAVATRRLRGKMALLLVGGVTAWLFADLGVLTFADGERDAALVRIGWLVACLSMTAATWVREEPEPAPVADVRSGTERARRSGIAIALVPVLLPGAIAVAQDLRGETANPGLLYATSVVLVGLAWTRGSRILEDEAAARFALRAQERFAQAAAMNSSDALALVDENGIVLNDAPQLAAMVGHAGWRTIGRDVFALILPEDQAAARAVFDSCLATPGQAAETEFRAWQRNGQEMWIGARVVNLLDDPFVGGVVVNIHDITARRRAEEELSHQAFHDGLTDLANRALFGDRVDHALRRNGRSGLDPVVIYLDLDGFKNVNDSLGHAAGDQLLREVAVRLNGAVRGGDTVARLGGDEFAILIDQSQDPLREAEVVAERVLQALADPIELDDQAVTVSASLGIAVGDGESTAASLLRDADVAMYRAKAAGRRRWVVYDPEMRSAAVERMQVESDLIRAVDEQQFALVYQPVIQLESDEIVGFEALIRWLHPTLGTVAPDRFIPVAEETGLIIPIGRWVLREATSTLARWHRDHPHHAALTMAINVSARQLASTDLVADVESALVESGIDAGALVIEITETDLIQDTTVAAERLAELSRLGVRLAVDDFGTGYSSLSYLRQFPIDILKIDRSFIDTITDRAKVPAIVRGLLDLGRTLQLETVAEGVELGVQRDQLRSENCDLAQGYLFSRPLDPSAAEQLLERLPAVEVAATAGA